MVAMKHDTGLVIADPSLASLAIFMQPPAHGFSVVLGSYSDCFKPFQPVPQLLDRTRESSELLFASHVITLQGISFQQTPLSHPGETQNPADTMALTSPA
jgi:hypothetical protein